MFYSLDHNHYPQMQAGIVVTISGVFIRRLTQRSDNRGWLTELYRQDEMHPEFWPRMGYVSMTLPGVKRGPHEHKYQADVFVFMGPGTVLVDLFDGRLIDGKPYSVTYRERMQFRAGADNPLQVIVPRGVIHSYENVGNSPAYVMNFPNQLYRGWEGRGLPDEIRYEGNNDHGRTDLPDDLRRSANSGAVAGEGLQALRAD